MIKVSIIVPMYNVENYIERCIESLINQTISNEIEIIIVNDGSTDKSKEKIKKYIMRQSETKENDKRKTQIVYIEKENGGLSSARNYGMKYAKGEYIAFLDSDDYVEPEMYEEMYKIATTTNPNADMVECDFIWEWEDKKIIDTRKKYKNQSEMMKKPRVVVWNKIFKREIIEKNSIQFPKGLIYEDIEFFYKIMPYITNYKYINKYYVHYTQRKNSISNSSNAKKITDIFQIIENILKYYKRRKFYNKYRKELLYMKNRILFGSSMKRILKIKLSEKKITTIFIKLKLIIKTFTFAIKINKKVEQSKKNIKRYNKSQKIFMKKIYINNHKEEKRKNICFGITKLGIGGAERVLVDLCNELQKDYNITIFTIYPRGELEKELDSTIEVKSLYDKNSKEHNKINSLILALFYRKIYNKYLKNIFDIEIAFLEGPITRIFSYGKNRKIAWIHNDISKVYGTNFKAKIKLIFDKHYYKKYEKIIFVSNQNQKAFEELYGKIGTRQVIRNYIDKNRIIEKSNCTIEKIDEHGWPKILTVARLVEQKGIDRLIKIHKMILDDGIMHIIYVIGDGPLKNELKNMVKKLKIEKTFIFLGQKENPYPYFKQVDLFALLSYYEGYGMVIEEAKILNLPIVITNTAAKEALKKYKKSIVIENNEKDIYEELKKILKENKYKNIKVKESYDNKSILQIQKLLQNL